MTMEVPLTRGMVALVDDSDFERIAASGPWHAYPGHLTHYARHSITASRQVTLHSFITGWSFVDHINGDGLDDRRTNLRAATQAQNNANVRLRRDNRSGFKGVASSRSGRWRAYIGSSPVLHIGTFDTPQEAARAYDAAAIKHFGEFARINFPHNLRSMS
jgi:AP2 domain